MFDFSTVKDFAIDAKNDPMGLAMMAGGAVMVGDGIRRVYNHHKMVVAVNAALEEEAAAVEIVDPTTED